MLYSLVNISSKYKYEINQINIEHCNILCYTNGLLISRRYIAMFLLERYMMKLTNNSIDSKLNELVQKYNLDKEQIIEIAIDNLMNEPHLIEEIIVSKAKNLLLVE